MGTRNLTLVQLNNEIKVAQYGQWDGYPSGQGKTILNFCRDKDYLLKLKENLSHVRFFTDDEIDCFNKLLDKKDEIALRKFNRYNHRDIAAGILKEIALSKDEEIVLVNDFEFGYNSLFCEWAYCINFDTNKLEVYEGFNCSSLSQKQRFYREKSKRGYFGVAMVKEYDLDNLPSEDVFLNELGDE